MVEESGLSKPTILRGIRELRDKRELHQPIKTSLMVNVILRQALRLITPPAAADASTVSICRYPKN
jgi:hypothetical protein